jgi:hypothetical protein
MKKVKSLFLCVLAFLTFTFVGSAYSHESKTEKVSLEKTTVSSDVEVSNAAYIFMPAAEDIQLFTYSISTIETPVLNLLATTKSENSIDFRYRYGTDLSFSYNLSIKKPKTKLHVPYLVEHIKLC